MILNLVEFDMDLTEAVAEPRFYGNSGPTLYPEATAPEEVQNGLRERGYDVSPFTTLGNVMAIQIDQRIGEYTGAADFRNGGVAYGP